MNYDHYYEIGSTHKICQDYAYSGEVWKHHVAIVCDGCSMTGEKIPIDVGVRFLGQAVLGSVSNTLKPGLSPEKEIASLKLSIKRIKHFTAISNLIREVGKIREFVNISPRYFDSTVVFAVTNGTWLRIYPVGDGGFFIKRKNSNIVQFTYIEYESGAPFYISYNLSSTAEAAYMAEFGESKVFVKTLWIDIEEKKIVSEASYSHKANDEDSLNKVWNYNSIDDIETVGVFSDGIHSFMNGKKAVSFEKIASEFASFKNYNGKFVERRLANGLAKKCRQEEMCHYDDISCAAINF